MFSVKWVVHRHETRRIERRLLQMADGFTYQAEKIFNEPLRVEYTEYVLPNLGAIRHWLANRMPDKWRERSEVKLSTAQ